ncbi:MAG: CobD/CbiB family cobalamin biosynthesis protein [Alphaproteobacteria bacterium]
MDPLSQGPAPVFLLFAALVVDAVLTGVPGLLDLLRRPTDGVRALTVWFDRHLNRERRGEVTRLVRGAFVVLFVVALAAASGWLAQRATRALPHGWILEIVLLMVWLGQGRLLRLTGSVARALERADVVAGARAMQPLLNQPADRDAGQWRGTDLHGVARATIEAGMTRVNSWVVAPVFWYAVLGLPGLFVYRAVNVMDGCIGHKTRRHASFGLVAARLDDALGAIPARLVAPMIVIAAALTPTARPRRAWRTMWRDAGRHRSFNAGWPMAAAAGALDLALAGPRKDGAGRSGAREPWIGDGRARVQVQDLRRARFLIFVTLLVNAAMVAGAALLLSS